MGRRASYNSLADISSKFKWAYDYYLNVFTPISNLYNTDKVRSK